MALVTVTFYFFLTCKKFTAAQKTALALEKKQGNAEQKSHSFTEMILKLRREAT